jgi:hypothetical protein
MITQSLFFPPFQWPGLIHLELLTDFFNKIGQLETPDLYERRGS